MALSKNTYLTTPTWWRLVSGSVASPFYSSRSAATILGGMLIGIERKTAAEYSFLAAVPAMCAAVGYDLLKSRSILHASDIPAFAIGFVVAFVAAAVSVK